MSPIRINRKGSKRQPASIKPVSLPTFSFYGHLPVIYADGALVVGRRVIPLERRK
ncbi:hypothetical protein [Bosea sp. (in: a-proteobacteria)]|uniref:hypothetical protein n=1 Tax=Bosea sp. (in: a-proteobacteria) TaxID=1871050 RepID=UPI003B3A675E